MTPHIQVTWHLPAWSNAHARGFHDPITAAHFVQDHPELNCEVHVVTAYLPERKSAA